MDDEKCLDLSLGLPGGSSSSQKGRFSNTSEARSNEDERDRKMINEFKNFLEGGNQHSLKFGENYYGQYAKSPVYMEPPKSMNNNIGTSVTNESRSTEFEEEERLFACEKRKSMFTKIDPKKKHAVEISHGDFNESTKGSHIPIADEGSTAENEDVADSEVDGSSSKHVPYSDDVPEQYAPSGSKYIGQKGGFHDSQNADIIGHKHPVSSEKERKLTDVPIPYGVSFPAQPPMSLPFSQAVKDLRTSGTLCLPSYPLPGIMHPIGTSSADRPSVQPVHSANFPLTFGYNYAQLPTLDRDNSRGIISNQQENHHAFPGRNQVNQTTQANVPVVSKKYPDSTQYDGRVLEHGKGNGKQQQHIGGQEDTSSQMKDDAKDPTGQHQAEAIPSDFQAIRPGMAADLKFGGSGSFPNLPWVSTTSPGPNRRTISGVTYRFSPTQIKIVCACHGSHMSPEEFIRHASEDTNAPPDASSGLAPLPSSNPAASARS